MKLPMKDKKQATDFRTCVINFSGNVGKTVLSQYMLNINMNPDKHFAITSLPYEYQKRCNEQLVNTKDIPEIFNELSKLDSAIVDVSLASTEFFINYLKENKEFIDYFDFFLVPSLTEYKNVKQTLETIETLKLLGVPINKIKVVFNKFNNEGDLELPLELIEKFNEIHMDISEIPRIKNLELLSNSEVYELEISELIPSNINQIKSRRNTLRLQEYRTKLEDIELKRLNKQITFSSLYSSTSKYLTDIYITLFLQS